MGNFQNSLQFFYRVGQGLFLGIIGDFCLYLYFYYRLFYPCRITDDFLAGILFPQPFATLYADMGMTFGGCIAFLAARNALGNSIGQSAWLFINKTKEGLKKTVSSTCYFYAWFPFSYQLVNLAPAFLHVPFKSFFWGSFLGYLPVAFILTQVGRGLGDLLSQTKELSLRTVLPMDAQLALIGVSLFALILVLVQKYKKRQSHG